MRRCLVALLVILSGGIAFAQDLNGFEKILLPVLSDVEGYGNAWFQTSLSVFSESEFAYWPAPSGGIEVKPAGDSRLAIQAGDGEGGRFLFVRRGDSSPVTPSLVVWTYMLPPDEYGILPFGSRESIPTPRVGDFCASKSILFNVWSTWTWPEGLWDPTTPDYRHMLRIYDAEGNGSGEVNVAVYMGDAPGLKLKEARVRLDRRAGLDAIYPYYAAIPIENTCLPLPPRPCISIRLRLEIEPVSPGLRYWAFVSSTGMASHDVSVTTPLCLRKPDAGAD